MSETQVLQYGVKSIPYIKAWINVGLGLDIPTGMPVLGKHGAYYHNGGHTGCIMFLGKGNSYKSALTDFINSQACYRVSPRTGYVSSITKYDTENNSSIQTMERRLSRITDEDWFDPDTRRFVVTDATLYAGEKWFGEFKKFSEMKIKLGASGKFETPFFDKKGKPIKIIIPTFGSIDSLSRWEPEVISTVREDSDIGDSKQNTVAGRANLFKANLVAELTTILPESGSYMCMTGHIKEKQNFSGDRTINTKDTPFMKADEKVSNIPSNINYLATAMYNVQSTNVLANKADRHVMEYPLKGYKDDNNVEDLNILQVIMVRSKTGGSGWVRTVLVSQKYGPLEGLTDFHTLRNARDTSLVGEFPVYPSASNSWKGNSIFLPDVQFNRSTVRSLIDENPRLQRALNIGHEIMQMKERWKDHLDAIDTRLWLLTPEEVYSKIAAQGYDWNTLLDTRYWWSLADDSELDNLYLSTTDILRMALELYVPYWLEADKRTIKKKYKDIHDRAVAIYEKKSGNVSKPAAPVASVFESEPVPEMTMAKAK